MHGFGPQQPARRSGLGSCAHVDILARQLRSCNSIVQMAPHFRFVIALAIGGAITGGVLIASTRQQRPSALHGSVAAHPLPAGQVCLADGCIFMTCAALVSISQRRFFSRGHEMLSTATESGVLHTKHEREGAGGSGSRSGVRQCEPALTV